MKRIAPFALLSVAVAAFIAMVTITGRFVPGYTPWAIYRDATLIPKMIMSLCLLGSIVVIVMAAIGARTRDALLVFAIALPLAGAFGALYGYMNMRIAAQITGTTRFDVLAPSYAEILLCLGAGFLPGAIAAFGRWRKA